jgi:heat shock protein HtpX
MIVGYVVAPLIRLAISRSREYLADACAARLTGKPMALAYALNKISGNSQSALLGNQETLSAMCIADPSTDRSPSLYKLLSGLSSTHPAIEDRIRALQKLNEG